MTEDHDEQSIGRLYCILTGRPNYFELFNEANSIDNHYR